MCIYVYTYIPIYIHIYIYMYIYVCMYITITHENVITVYTFEERTSVIDD